MNIVKMRLNLYCCKCNVLMKVGHEAVKIDGATFHHVVCPTTNMRHFAAHKQPKTGLVIGDVE